MTPAALLTRLVLAGMDAVLTADRLGCRAFPYRVPRDLILDRILGPVEDFEPVALTTPKRLPQTIS